MIADIHLAPPGAPPTMWHGPIHGARMRPVLAEAIALLRREPVDALVLVGDLAEHGDRGSMDVALGDCARLGLPMFVVPGNHDISDGNDVLARACAARTSLAEMLTSRGRLFRQGLRIAGQRIAATADAGIAAEIPDPTEWNGDVVIWVCHYPALSRQKRAERAGVRYAGDLPQSSVVADILVNRPHPTVVLHGHAHFRDAVSRATLLQIGLPALAESPHEAAVIEMTLADELVVTMRGVMLEQSALEAAPTPAFAPRACRWRFGLRRWQRDGHLDVFDEDGRAPFERIGG